MRIEVIVEELRHPEGPFCSSRDGCVYFTEWIGNRIWAVREGKAEPVREAASDEGPCGLWQDRDGNLWVCMYSGRKLAKLTPSGEMLQSFDNFEGEPFKGPNELVGDAKGGVYFTDSGDFDVDWLTGRPAGSVYYLSPERKLLRVDSELCFPNGIALSPDCKTLAVCEHRKNRLLKYSVNPDGSISDRKVLFTLDGDCLLDEGLRHEMGPDGMCCDSRGNFWAAHYGGGRVVVLDHEGALINEVVLPGGRKPTNVAVAPDGKTAYVTESELGVLYRIALE